VVWDGKEENVNTASTVEIARGQKPSQDLLPKKKKLREREKEKG